MSAFLLGLATLPAIAVGGYLLAFITAHAIALAGKAHLGVLRRYRPDGTKAEAMAAVVYGCRKGSMFSLGNFAIVVVTDIDWDKRREGLDRLNPPRRLRRSTVSTTQEN